MHRGASRPRIVLLTLLLCAAVCAQAAGFLDHSHQHSSHHCCILCHGGSLPYLQPRVGASIPELAATWLDADFESVEPLQAHAAAESSRAPPA